MAKLTVLSAKSLSTPGMHCDGEGLYLRVGDGNAKSWILRTAVFGRRKEIGLGSFLHISLAEARTEARRLRKVARAGGDPETKRKRESLTFEEAARAVFESSRRTWKNKKHTETWWATVETHAGPLLAKRPIETITTADILAVLQPIWTDKHETANRLKQRLSTIFDWAKGSGHYRHENPVNGVAKALPLVKPVANHMDAMAWKEVPAFLGKLRSREGVSARTLEFLILTATRSGEARGARWSEIDKGGAVWTIPGDRMKRGLPHRVPLAPASLALVEQMRGIDTTFIFPSASRSPNGSARPQSDMVFKSLYLRMGVTGFTTHGFRSSFRDWCSEVAHADREVAEAALAHATGNQTERSYARSDLFERRRHLMKEWAAYVEHTLFDPEAASPVQGGSRNSESPNPPSEPKRAIPKRRKLAKHKRSSSQIAIER